MLTSWLAEYARICGSMSPLGLISLISDLSIAIAYLMIPTAMTIFLWKRSGDLPHPWLVLMFGMFITACGLTHLVHAAQMPFTTFEHTTIEAAVKAVCAVLSIGTASALIWLMPTLLSLQTATQVRTSMDGAVRAAVAEKNELIWEINHRCGNQIQVMQSVLRTLARSSASSDRDRVLALLTESVTRIADEHAASAKKYDLEAPLERSRLYPSHSPATADVKAHPAAH